jgi:hypothetical protein
MAQITTEDALQKLIKQGVEANIHPLNIEKLESMVGSNPAPWEIEFYADMINAHILAGG